MGDQLTLRGTLVGHGGWITAIATTPEDPNMILSSSRDRSVIVWALTKEDGDNYGYARRSLRGHNHFVSDVVISSDGQFALTGSWDNTLRLWDINSGVCTRRFVGHTKDVLSVAFSADNRQIVSGSRDRTVKLWNTLGECKFTIVEDGHTEWVSCVRFSPSPSAPVIVSAGWDRLVKVWNLGNCKLRNNLSGHNGYLDTVTVSPDGSLCASGGKDGVAMLWDLTEGKRLYSLEAGDIIHSLVFSHTRKRMDSKEKDSAKGSAEGSVELFKCVPVDWLWLPRPFRLVLGWIIVILFSLSFLSIPISLFLLIPAVWKYFPLTASLYLAALIISFLLPLKEWPYARKWCQLTYEVFQVSGNLSTETLLKAIEEGEHKKFMIGMHPHGIIPIHALIWCAYCDQYMSDGTRGLYGFGAMADAVSYVPFLRNAMCWLAGGSASYKALHDGLTKGKSPVVNASGRIPRHLYILPGGVAEIFLSTPGKHEIITSRKGLMRLALETGTNIFPCYVFGGTDFFNNLATGDNFFSRFSRRYRMGLALFYGQFGLPMVPYAPRVTLCIADAIEVQKWEGEGPVPQEMIEELQAKYAKAFQELFEKYKAVAGYPDSVLKVQ